MTEDQQEGGRSNALALLGFGVSAASTAFITTGSFTIFAAPVGLVLLFICLHYEREVPRTGPGAYGYALVVGIAGVMIIGWILNSIVPTQEDGTSYIQLVATALLSVGAHMRRADLADRG